MILTDDIVEFSLFASLLELKLFIFFLTVLWLKEFSVQESLKIMLLIKKPFKTALRFLEFGVHFYWTVKNPYQRIMKAIGAQV